MRGFVRAFARLLPGTLLGLYFYLVESIPGGVGSW